MPWPLVKKLHRRMDEALAKIERGRSTAYDPTVVYACLNLFCTKDYKFAE